MNIRIAFFLVIVGLAIVGFLWWQQQRPEPFVVSGFVEADEIRVGSRVGGRVAEVFVDEGQRVEPGAVLYRILPFDLEAKLAQARARLASFEAKLKQFESGYRTEAIAEARGQRERVAATLAKLVAGPRQQEIGIARQELKSAQADLTFAQSEYDRIKKLRDENKAAQTELDLAWKSQQTAEASVAVADERLNLLLEGTRSEEIAEAQAALAVAEANLALLESGYRSEDVEQAAAQVTEARAEVDVILKQIEELSVVSPCACLVDVFELRPGDLVAPNAPTASLLDTSILWVRAYVPEDRLGLLELGQGVPVSVDTFSEERFGGRLGFIARRAEFTPRNVQTPEERSRLVYRIKVYLEEGLDRLQVGMAADVHFDEVNH